MKTILHKAETRGTANFGWLDSKHTFSFGHYHNPSRIHFGALRVLNDDTVKESRGFDTHPHRDMEIISIPIEGDLEHKDSMGNTAVIKQGDIQVMSAGTGVQHSEYNKNPDKEVKFLQIWVFPNKSGVEPRYDQQSMDPAKRKNAWDQVLSPNPDDDGVWIHQDAWFQMGELDEGVNLPYTLKNPENGVYVFVLNGEIQIGDKTLTSRDGLGVSETSEINFKAIKKSQVLLMEVPMDIK